MKTPFLDYWTSRKERGEILEKRHETKLTSAQRSTLLNDSDVRAALQKSRVASLLPPVGTEVFRRFTPTTKEQIKKCMDSSKKNKLVEEDSVLKPASELESEKTLPFFYGVPPPELRNIPLEDPDPFYQSQKTFVVVDRENNLSRYNAESSCFHFSPFSLFRRAAIKILNHKLFTALVCVALLLDFGLMGRRMPWGYILELIFLSVYTLEAMLKILSRGFCFGRFTYLRDSWNRLDFVIVVTGIPLILLEDLDFFKALRFLKILGLFPATRRNAKLFGRVMNRLWDVFLFTLLVLSVFSIIGAALMSGSLRNKCVMSWPWETRNSSDWSNSTDSDDTTEGFDYKAYVNNPGNLYFMKGKLDAMICGNSSSASVCPEGYRCLRTSTNPNYGLSNFDNFGYAFFSTFRLMIRDFWEDLGHMAMQAEGQSIMMYFVVVFFFCTFSLTMFIISTFTINFVEQTEREVKEAKQDRRDYDMILTALKDKVEDDLPEKKDEKVSCWRRVCSCDCSDCWVRVKNGLKRVVLDPFFDLAIVVLIIIYICLISTRHYPMTAEFEQRLSEAELVFTLLFLLEVVLKIVALGPYEFFEVNWHYFDTVLVVFSIAELALVDIEGFSLMYLDNVFRLFRLGRWWPGLLKWMRLTWAGMLSLWTLSITLIIFFFTIFGFFMFSESYTDNVCRIAQDCYLPRWHFSSYFHSFMTVTRAIFGEWIETLWDCFATSNDFVCVVFYATLLIVANFLILSLLLTLLMKWISDKMAPKDEEKMRASTMRLSKMLKVCGINVGGKAKDEERVAADDTAGVALSCVTSEQTEENGTQSSTLPIGEAQNFQKMKETEDAAEDPDDCCCQKCYSCCPALNLDKSQGCGRVWANLRRAAFNILQHPYFNNFIFFIILISSFALVGEDMYLPTRPVLQVFLGYLDQVITYLFVLEVLFKWLGLGFNRYFRDGWCWLDLIVTLACVLSVAAQTSSLDPYLISLKALRPLRILAHIKGTKRSVCALLKMVPPLVDVLLVTLTVWLFFAIVFVGFYAGKFYYCYNETSEEIFPSEDVHNKTECMMLIVENYTEVRWKNAVFNFDSTTNAYVTLFSMATLKGWIDTWYFMSDSSMIEDQPEYERNIYLYLAIPFFILFGCFFCLIHILKVLFDTYSSLTQKMGGSHLFLTEKQMKNFNDRSFCSKRPLAPCARPLGRLRGRLFDLVSRECFEWAMQGVILFTVVLLMIDRYDVTIEEEEALYWLSFTVTVIFLLEFLLKICAFSRSYFSDNLNKIDFAVLILQIVGLFLEDFMYYHAIHPSVLSLLRLGRISRIIHRVPGSLRLRLLFAAWRRSLPAIFNLVLLLFVLMVTYASFGTFHFSQLQKTALISDTLNFETFSRSLICMWIITTWGGWDGLLLPSLHYPPDCEPEECGSPALGMTFFLSFLCLSSFLVLMMVLVVLVDMLNMFGEMHCDPLSVLNLSRFFKTWRKVAPDSSHFIQRSRLPDLCDKLKKPLRIPKGSGLGLELSGEEQVHCRDVLLALSVQALGDGADRDALRDRIDEKYHEFLPNSPSQESCEMSQCTLQMDQEEATTVEE